MNIGGGLPGLSSSLDIEDDTNASDKQNMSGDDTPDAKS